MGWRDLLQEENERITLPWTGGRSLRSHDRTWTIQGRMPPEFGWYQFLTTGRKASANRLIQEDPLHDLFIDLVQGYLIGDRLIFDSVRVDPNPAEIIKNTERVYLVEEGLDRFVRISAGRIHSDGPLIYRGQEMPLGPEEEVLSAFLDQKSSVDDVKNVAPALDSAFRFENWRREEAEKRRLEAEKIAREAEERRLAEERKRELYAQLGDGQSRRALAQTDFATAARAALAIGDAEYLDHRASHNRNEMIVRFRFQRQRFECVCNRTTLQIIDAGICLRGYGARGVDEVGDTYFTLESLPTVIAQAIREGVLHVFRHA